MSGEYEIWRSTGNWKRHICAWFGHHNIGTRDLLWGTPETLCLRCRQSESLKPVNKAKADDR